MNVRERNRLTKKARELLQDWWVKSGLFQNYRLRHSLWIRGYYGVVVTNTKTYLQGFFYVENTNLHEYKWAILQLTKQIEDAYREQMIMAELRDEVEK
jgi:hypothetical protein